VKRLIKAGDRGWGIGEKDNSGRFDAVRSCEGLVEASKLG
jgi:hypothetical protein